MKLTADATGFEYRHQLLTHQILVAVAFLTYLFDRDDVVWYFVKGSADHSRDWERALFAAGTLLIGIAALLSTWARARASNTSASGDQRVYFFTCLRDLGDWFYSVGLGTLAPRLGFLILAIGEAIRIVRVRLREKRMTEDAIAGGVSSDELGRQWHNAMPIASSGTQGGWLASFRLEIIKWMMCLTMIIFTATLRDSLAEGLAVASFLIWALLNGKEQFRVPNLDAVARR